MGQAWRIVVHAIFGPVLLNQVRPVTIPHLLGIFPDKGFVLFGRHFDSSPWHNC
jgi:hypothetical protein